METANYTVNEEGTQIVSELADDVPDAVIDYQVSGGPKRFT